MRLDKFLKVSRLVKRRTLAKELCDAGRVSLGDRVAKGSSPVQIGDILSIRYGHKRITVEVLQLMDNPRKEQASSLYRVLSEERLEQVNTHFVDDEE
ncbi:RNA-binding S4 domain-containing protein [Alicyclobacillus sp. TC]|uniref:RQC P-site tRNA stabilizing factor n=1 Tax=Alicyclobacillus tolerans TaxID=90970 RepID=A0A1M6PFS6_9BACL|nr:MULTISPECIES: RNA-binding S4 domain-containing protein [Alicyclobacillus]QRF22359.1 RNA-binding S4 domain-containing protein [Alicyclobacillus sp. TC]SHK06805.1 Ribosomal 50S subunit-recycling heat shock protein, contains S4 domain [Alicyclobacillus montanus]